MIVGVPKEIKKHEYRVALTPEGVMELRTAGASVLVEAGAGEGSGFTDEQYESAGAEISDKKTLFAKADLIVKVKEPLSPEFNLLRDGQMLFTYLHLAPDPVLTEALLGRNVTAFAYETLEVNGQLPLLSPMSEIAGRMAPLAGSYYLQKFQGGTGVLPAGATGTAPCRCLVLGAGVVGANACRTAFGIGMETTVLNRGIERLREIDNAYRGRVRTGPLTQSSVRKEIQNADLIIGALLSPGGRTPVVVHRDMLKTMKAGSVIVDVSIDQGGCVETSTPRTHDDPIYRVDDIIHYTVANMPGTYPRTSTLALTNATLPWIIRLTSGLESALQSDALRKSLNLFRGKVRNRPLADAQGIPWEKEND